MIQLKPPCQSGPVRRQSVRLAAALVLIAVLGAPASAARAASGAWDDPESIFAPVARLQPAPDPAVLLAERWGVKVEAMRLSAAGYMLDFRFRVLDPGKAAPLFDKEALSYLLDEATGARMGVPSSPKIGAMRSSGKSIQVGRTYFVLFGNPGCYVKSGHKVTVVIGDFRAEGLRVDGPGEVAAR